MALTEMLDVHTLRSLPLGLNEFWHEHSKGAATVLWRIERSHLALLGRSGGRGTWWWQQDILEEWTPSFTSGLPPLGPLETSPPPMHPTDSLIFYLSRKIAFSEREGTHMT